MVYDPQNGLGWTDTRGWQVSFGSNAKDMALKLQVYQSLVNSLTQAGNHSNLHQCSICKRTLLQDEPVTWKRLL